MTKISIHALHEESDVVLPGAPDFLVISIHALHEESDERQTVRRRLFRDFNPRSP